MNNQNLHTLTQLAEASYARFDKYPTSEQNIALKDKGFSETQSADLLSNWSIASHQPNTANGFSATLFKSKVTNSQPQYVLAIENIKENIKGSGLHSTQSNNSLIRKM
jgi:hypothetical protein